MSFDSPTIYFLSISNLSSFYEKIPFSHKFGTFFWSSLGNFPFKCQINLPIHCVSKLWSILRILKLRLDHMLHPNPRFLNIVEGSKLLKYYVNRDIIKISSTQLGRTGHALFPRTSYIAKYLMLC